MTCHSIQLGPGTAHLLAASGAVVLAVHDGFTVQVRMPGAGVRVVRDPRRLRHHIYEYTWHSVSCVCRGCLAVDQSARHLTTYDTVVFLQPDD